MTTRPFNVVVWGASGFTGRLVCRHLARDYQGKVKWAMAGRNESKLKEVRAELAQEVPEAANVALVIANAKDKPSLNAMAKQTDAVIAMVGPYERFGRPVVEACIEEGAHYCDITGETTFARHCIEEYGEKAKAAGVKIVHFCGFDSVPADVTALMTADYIQKRYGASVDRSEGVVMASKGGFSGGTLESGLNLLTLSKEQQKIAAHPYALDPERWDQDPSAGPDKPLSLMPKKLPNAGFQTGPFFMSVVNEAAVRRSRVLNGYGENFKYIERLYTGSWFFAALVGFFTALGGVALPLMAKVPFLRARLPSSGDGPSQETREKGFYHWSNFARGVKKDGSATPVVVAHLKDMKRDPGYWSTSRMILECALGLALEQDALKKDPYASKNPAGVLTPASALGLVLVERLKNAGYTAEVGEWDGKVHIDKRKD